MLYPSRDLHGPAQSRAVRDLLQSLLVAELIHPSPKLWLFCLIWREKSTAASQKIWPAY